MGQKNKPVEVSAPYALYALSCRVYTMFSITKNLDDVMYSTHGYSRIVAKTNPVRVKHKKMFFTGFCINTGMINPDLFVFEKSQVIQRNRFDIMLFAFAVGFGLLDKYFG